MEIQQKRRRLEKQLADLKEKLRDREAALPAHSVKPHQLQAIEELEGEIVVIEKELEDLENSE
jgi:hypothetical protein